MCISVQLLSMHACKYSQSKMSSKVFQKNTFFDFNVADNIFPLYYTM